ncbi:MAG: ATPase [Alphaproteobacteria bacterium]|nr:ATPase [Alphaproteobacteria bacterium]
MKRFYREASVVAEEGRYSVVLDGRPVLSPGRSPLELPAVELANAIAAEWNAQGDDIVPESMPMTRFANSAIDRIRPRRDGVVSEIAAYAETDLLCYRAAAPADLVERQSFTWQPLLDWIAEHYGAVLNVTQGVMPLTQNAEATALLRAQVAMRDVFVLSALHSITAASGSLVIALAVVEGRIGPEEAAAASLIDETFQAEKWGEDPESVARWDSIGTEIAAAARFLAATSS